MTVVFLTCLVLAGLLPGWQERSHLLATWGRDHPWSQGFSLTDALCLLRDVPVVLRHGQALVILYVSLFSELHDEAEWCDSELSVQLAGSGFRSDVWCAVCDDSEVPLVHHRVAAYLSLLPSMPHTFFDVPSCRFCDLGEGNQWAHVQYCSVLYLRMGHALVALVEEVAQRVRVLSCDMTDLLARMKVPGGVLVVGVVPEQEVQSVSTWADSVLGASQVVLVSWTGLVHLSAQVPWRPSRSDGVALAKVVLARMSCDVPRDEMLLQAPRRTPFMEGCRVRTDGAGFEGCSVGVRARAQVSVSVQRLVAWLLHVVPGATLPWVTDLSVRVQPRALGQGGPYTLQVLYCDVLRCQAAEAGLGYRNACVVCSCERGHAPHWDFYALYDTVALYVSREFTVPVLQLF